MGCGNPTHIGGLIIGRSSAHTAYSSEILLLLGHLLQLPESLGQRAEIGTMVGGHISYTIGQLFLGSDVCSLIEHLK